MSLNILVIGESGSGKSSSIRTLDANETFIINVLDKPLPFKEFKKNYIKLSADGGNYYSTHDYKKIERVIEGINEKRPDIKNVIIDDFQYLMANEYMEKALERGFDKFVQLAKNVWNLIKQTATLREDLCFFFLSHNQVDNDGHSKCKTIGKMLDEKVALEGMFTIVLHSMVKDDCYKFLTQNDGIHVAKSPMGMFKDRYIDNDLHFIKEHINNYYGDIPEAA